MRLFRAVLLCHMLDVQAFLKPIISTRTPRMLTYGQKSIGDRDVEAAKPTVIATGFSTLGSIEAALDEAVGQALQPFIKTQGKVDLAILSVSSLYDVSPTTVFQTIQQRAAADEISVENLIGSSVAGCISSTAGSQDDASILKTVEFESLPCVSITLMQLPDCHIQTFHVEQVPDDVGRLSDKEWNRAIGLNSFEGERPIFMLIPSPGFSTQVQDLLYGLSVYWPGCTTVGGLASTVSSLSRAKLFQYGSNSGAACFAEGCVGVALTGDIQIQSMMAQGAKPVGGVYQILKGQDSTISVIVLDETATAALHDDDGDEDEEQQDDEDEQDSENTDAKTRAAQTYAKANIPKPPLAEANFIMKSLSDDDQAFMRRQLLIGLAEQPVARTASELARLSQGQGHAFMVQQVASAGMKDGSVTLPLGSVQITPGQRLRFFVRESEFAKKEVEALWMGYKKRLLNEQFSKSTIRDDTTDESLKFTPAACFIIPTLDRGNKFFLGKPGFESSAAARIMPGVPCISGFFSNGVIARMDDADNVDSDDMARIHGSASGYFLIGSRSGRPIYSPANQAAQEERLAQERAAQEARAQALAAEDAKRLARTTKVELEQKAPRRPNGELLLKRREVHSGRALTVSTVEWSVAEKTAKPSSTLEGFMWDKETEVDRFRERVPLANLVSQCRLSASDPTAPKPRDFVGPIQQAARQDGTFVIVPECKRTEPVSGSLWRRYDIAKLTREFTLAGVPAMSVNCDGVLFGGSMDDITKARESSSVAAIEQISQDDGVVVPPILASDLILYPYQLYKLRLAGADAVNLVAGALDRKDLIYLSKIASSLQLQVLVTVTSQFQIGAVTDLPAGSVHGIIVSNRELEDFSFDMTGDQALLLLRSDALTELKAKHGDIPVLVEGRVGLIERDGSAAKYVQELQKVGALGAIVGGGLARDENNPIAALQSLQCID